jgi:putative endonuclease
MLCSLSTDRESILAQKRAITMQNKRQKFGQKSESLAAWYLKKIGYKIVEQNYRTPLGEIDIIAREKKTIVFVEVKSRRSTRYGNPKWAVTPKKQRKISMVALQYLKATRQTDARARFDVVAVTSNRDEPHIEIVKNAFELAYK